MQNPWSQHASLYDQAQGEIGDFMHELLFDPAIEKCLGSVTGQTLLDAGCGNGYWVRRLAKTAKKVVGIDESKELVDIAKGKDNPSNVEFRVMDLNGTLDLPGGIFDAILSSMVLHYIPSLQSVAVEFARVLKADGRIVICVQHPMFQYHFRAQDLLGKKTDVFPQTAGYFERKELTQVTLQGKAEITTYNRPMEDYLQPFFENGFVLTDFIEPESTDALVAKNPRYKEIKEVPRVVILGFSRKV